MPQPSFTIAVIGIAFAIAMLLLQFGSPAGLASGRRWMAATACIIAIAAVVCGAISLTLLLLDIDLNKAVSPSGGILPTRSESKQYVRPIMITIWLGTLASAVPIWSLVVILRGMRHVDRAAPGGTPPLA